MMQSLCNKWFYHCQKVTIAPTQLSPSTYLRIVQKLKQVLRTSISGINTSFLFADASFINDCLLQLTLHVNHPLLQFAAITFRALLHCFPDVENLSRFHSHRIHTWTTIWAASYLARWIQCNVSFKSAAIVVFEFHKVV